MLTQAQDGHFLQTDASSAPNAAIVAPLLSIVLPTFDNDRPDRIAEAFGIDFDVSQAGAWFASRHSWCSPDCPVS